MTRPSGSGLARSSWSPALVERSWLYWLVPDNSDRPSCCPLQPLATLFLQPALTWSQAFLEDWQFEGRQVPVGYLQLSE